MYFRKQLPFVVFKHPGSDFFMVLNPHEVRRLGPMLESEGWKPSDPPWPPPPTDPYES